MADTMGIYEQYEQLGREAAREGSYQNAEDAYETEPTHYSLDDDEDLEAAATGFADGFALELLKL